LCSRKSEEGKIMEAYAVVETGSKQYRVEKDDVVRVERIPAEVGETIDFDAVLAVSDGEKLTVGAPVVEGAKVSALIVEHLRDKKKISFKKKRRKGYKRKVGHRQEITRIKVLEISAS